MKTKSVISAKPLNYLISVLCLLMLCFVPVKDIQTDISFVKSNSKIDICDTEAGSIPEGYNLIYEQDFENHKALNDFVFANPDNWSIAKHEGNGVLELSGESQYKPTVNSPLNMALLVWRRVGDFVLECDMMQTGRAYSHRDMCLFFNFQVPDKYYYSHIATKTDDHAHNIFIVDSKPRTKISHTTTPGVDWGKNQWRKVRIQRDSKAGTIKVYYDDMTTPIMTASDTTFKEGWVGFGSFDDSGRVDNIKLWAPGKLQAWRPTCFPSKPVEPIQPQPKIDGPDFKTLFDGKTLAGWKPLNGSATFTVEDGSIVGTCNPKAKQNSYLSTEKTFRDFIFACEVKFDKLGNSGIQIRSRQREHDGLVTGYQIEIDHSDRRWSGGLYEERGRGWFTPLVGDGNGKAREAFNLQEWNTIVIKAQGNHIQTWINGVPIADFYDNDKKLSASEGFFGLQVHWPVKPEWTGQLRWRNLRIRELDNNLKQ